ncbi:hypothetical protein CSE16_20190 [Solibacillus sp. R5-41]|uniref:hypothetical protein n=1 Tax=Solibacillus sp. R5-41 TaxID=2048654 RepID=UPI000C124E0B|nr:hypothetical protein [Solibacillus sp. R5-41]ATP42143.1 hypothetical protein CSE16_20190 [Solibacillus sp. R5-41]
MEISIGGMIGLYGGMLCGLLGWWFGRKKARENRGLDELYYHIWQRARSYSWYLTLCAIYVFFSLIMFGVELSTAMVLGLILLTHLGSWAIIGIVLTINMTVSPSKQLSRAKVGLIVVACSFTFFTTLSIVTGNWLFLLWSILPNVVVLTTTLIPARKNTE